MTQNELQDRSEEIFLEIRKMLQVKAADYAPAGDRLGNFRRRATIQRADAAQICFSDMLKHIDAMGVWLSKPKEILPVQTLHERIMDALTYLILLDALTRPIINYTEFTVPPPAYPEPTSKPRRRK